jgi:hypothetical protein
VKEESVRRTSGNRLAGPNRHGPRLWWLLVLVAGVLALVAAGCGGGDEEAA